MNRILRHGPALLLPLLLLVLGAAIWLTVGIGSEDGRLVMRLTWPRLVLRPNQDLAASGLWELLAARAMAAALAGAALAVAGAVLQRIARNPLADPYLLGVSGGAAVAVVAVHALPGELSARWVWLTPAVAFAGAQLANSAVMLFARSAGRRLSTVSVVLAGVMVNALCGACITLLMATLPPVRLRVTSDWLWGDIRAAAWPHLGLVAAALGVGLVYVMSQAHRLNALALGTRDARALGVNAERLTLFASFAASLLTGAAVSVAGLLGYVGLVVPHLARMLLGSDLRRTLPSTAVAGAILLVVADGGARAAHEALPVGVLTACIGCPVLLYLLRAELRSPP